MYQAMMSEIKDIQFAIHNVFENITDNAISNDIIEPGILADDGKSLVWEAMSEREIERKKLFLHTVAGALCIVAIGFALEWYHGVIENSVFNDIYYAISNTGQVIATGSEEQFMHVTIIAQYFERAIIPDFLKMMNLLVVFLFYQGLQMLSLVHVNDAATVKNSVK